MKKLRVIAIRDQRDDLMRALVHLGCVQVHEPDEMLLDPDAAALLRPERAGLMNARNRQAEVQSAIKVLERYAPAKKKLLASRPEIRETEFLDDEALERDYALAQQLNDWDSQLKRITAEESRLRAEIESLRPWEALDAPLSGAGTKTCCVLLGTAPAETDMVAVAEAVDQACQESEVMLVSEDEQQHCFIVITLRQEADRVEEALKEAGCGQAAFPGETCTASEGIDARERQLAELAAQKTDITAQVVEQGPQAPALRLTADRLATEAARAEASERLRGTDNIVAMEGWCPAPDVERLETALGKLDCAWEFSDPDPEEYPDVPVKLQNKKLVQSMNVITDMYSLPAYDGVDPNALMFPFFILFYGIMFADMGYGLLMILIGIIAKKTVKPRGGAGHLMTLMLLGGISTFVFGALTGGFFGDFLPQLAAVINPDTTFTEMPSLFTPLDDTMMILIGSLVLGVVQIFTGMIVSVVHKCKNGEFLSALFDEITWWCILIGLVLIFLGTPVLLIIGAVLLVVGQFVQKKSLMGGLTGLFGAIYNGVTGYFSDILSYSRLMALMLAGSVIAMVFNTLGAMTGNVVVFIIIALIGNALNFGLNLLGCFVHDLRLQVLEFFNRFYKDGGKAFKPLAVNTKYVDIIKEEI
ncbi:MAG: V-type ATP synthase subunit I [Oscillospiraceae bacterium]|nr:V-type ATP synthase subunit I [Oscillospiraceae bacterium]